MGAGRLAAQQPTPTGFTPAAAANERRVETLLTSVPDTGRARAHVKTLSAEPHVAGTPEQTRTADYVLRQMAGFGLDTARVSFRVYMPYPESTVVARVKPTPVRFALEEPALPEDPTSQGKIWPAMNGYSGAGDVTAPLVYVNYGLIEDYRTLDSLGISVRGKLAIARYGRSFRGIKAREAEKHGAVGLIIYSDPIDDGYVRGDVYPRGPMRHPDAPQRGSIFNGDGDPSTPSWPSTMDARHLPLDSMEVPRIPVVPIGYRNAAQLLEGLGGSAIPQAWQGGLPFRYHIGGDGAVTARVAVWPEQGAKAYKTIINTVATLRGSVWPDEWVIVGGHRDGWGPGASDNISGVTTILESARAWGTAAKQGLLPRRTILFATWDAEEWGLVGSSEWAELMEKPLLDKAVAYLNQDVSAAGRQFGSAATPSLQPFVRELTKSVMQPDDTVSVYAAWKRAGGRGPGATPGAEPTFGDLGGGSDFAGFYNHLGLPSFEFGFSGSGGGSYHSAYDSYAFVSRFADPGFIAHAAAARVDAVMLARLANADIVPLDYEAFGAYLQPLIERVRGQAKVAALGLDLSPLEAAARKLRGAGTGFNAARDALLAGSADPARIARANALLRTVEPAMTRPEGLVGRPWMRNLIFVADRDNGYANMALPSIAEAIRDGDAARAQREVEDLADRVRTAAERVEAARAAL
jgi:N-acetylated-alpha-linked acidic dipeptidase